ncbi:MAG: hypothetical protein Q7J05_04260 [Paludibacter sp.]|nr:hypothetical protein [Paludibacter sp.]
MKVGTKSVLFGAHCFLLHPLFVAIAWIKLFGWPWDPRVWIAFFVHDLGYIGKPNMDGYEGETHVELGAKIMGIFGKEWSDFSKYHSRHYAKRDNAKPSKLCFADKLAIYITPWWLYLPLVNLTGEIKEYMTHAQQRETKRWKPVYGQREWFRQLGTYMKNWVYEHIDGSEDIWTEKRHENITEVKPHETRVNWNHVIFLITCIGGSVVVWTSLITLLKHIAR